MLAALKVNLPAKKAYTYPIFIANGLLANWQAWLPMLYCGKQVILITDNIVEKLYAKILAKDLESHGYLVLYLVIDHGEAAKNRANKEYLESTMLKHKIDRHSLCIALGGGVVGDLTGFLAATYMRGIKFVQIPTTLLSMIDSSVGGKTSVNTPEGKNLIGAFWQPQAVIMDVNVLKSLSKVQIINGLIEAIKIFLTSDIKSFNYLLKNLEQILALDNAKIVSVIKRAVKLKANVVKIDEKEENLRMILNFGHTIAHALEKLSNYKLLHGYAVAIGILVESQIAVLLGYLSSDKFKLIQQLMCKLQITAAILKNFDLKQVILATIGDKKNRNGEIFCILLTDIGSVYLDKERVATAVKQEVIYQALINVMNG